MDSLNNNKNNDFVLISGSSNQDLSLNIAKKLSMDLSKIDIRYFNNSEIDIRIFNNIRNKIVFIIQTGSTYNNFSTNDMLMELFLIINACELSSAKEIITIIPNLPYARSDKKTSPRCCIGASVVCRLLKTLSTKRIITMDLHAGQIQGFINLPIDNLYAIKYLLNQLFISYDIYNNINDYVLVSPDLGALKRIKEYSNNTQIPYVVINKERNYNQVSQIDKVTIYGDIELLKNKNVIIVDDIVDTMGTMKSVIDSLLEYQIKNVIIVATHGILSGPAINRINECDIIKNVIVTNSICQKQNIAQCNKIISVDVSALFAHVIDRIVNNGSISELFE